MQFEAKPETRQQKLVKWVQLELSKGIVEKKSIKGRNKKIQGLVVEQRFTYAKNRWDNESNVDYMILMFFKGRGWGKNGIP